MFQFHSSPCKVAILTEPHFFLCANWNILANRFIMAKVPAHILINVIVFPTLEVPFTKGNIIKTTVGSIVLTTTGKVTIILNAHIRGM